jgi:hypothetical protein
MKNSPMEKARATFYKLELPLESRSVREASGDLRSLEMIPEMMVGM